MKKHLNKILIFVINGLLMVIGVLLIKDYNDKNPSANNEPVKNSGDFSDFQVQNYPLDVIDSNSADKTRQDTANFDNANPTDNTAAQPSAISIPYNNTTPANSNKLATPRTRTS